MFKRRTKQAIQQNGKAVERWLNEEYPVIVKRAKQENATIFWEDETAVQQDTNWVRGYAPCGQTPTIKHDRRSCYGAPVMISAVNNQGLSFFMFESRAIRWQTFIKFLHRLIRDIQAMGKKLFVICDNVRVHHAKPVKAWCQKRKDEIELFFLPTYSPELNPDEFLNRTLKTHLRLRAPRDHAQTLKLAKQLPSKFKREKHQIRACFDAPTTRYAKAA